MIPGISTARTGPVQGSIKSIQPNTIVKSHRSDKDSGPGRIQPGVSPFAEDEMRADDEWSVNRSLCSSMDAQCSPAIANDSGAELSGEWGRIETRMWSPYHPSQTRVPVDQSSHI